VTYEETPEKAAHGVVSEEELEKNMVFRECDIKPLGSQAKAEHVCNLILLLQLCCENCYTDF
jgi:hypothetical protein